MLFVESGSPISNYLVELLLFYRFLKVYLQLGAHMCAVGNMQGNTLDLNVSFAYESTQPVAARHTAFIDMGSFKVTVVIDCEYSHFGFFRFFCLHSVVSQSNLMRMSKPAKYLHEDILCEYVGQGIHEIKFTLPYWMHFGISRSIFYFFF